MFKTQIIFKSFIAAAAISLLSFNLKAQSELSNEITESIASTVVMEPNNGAIAETDSIDGIAAIDPVELFESIETQTVNPNVLNRSFMPRVFSGYRKLNTHKPAFLNLKPYRSKEVLTAPEPIDEFMEGTDSVANALKEFRESLEMQTAVEDDIMTKASVSDFELPITNLDIINTVQSIIPEDDYFTIHEDMPQWLRKALVSNRFQEDLMYSDMIDNPFSIEYSYWDLPEAPVLKEDDISFINFIKKLKLPEVEEDAAIIPEVELRRKYWLHTFGSMLQFSEAFVSPNWYQGGNNYLALLFNFNWSVRLNEVYHPKLLFQSDLNYKLAISSNPKGAYHPYTISEDAFQYNMNAGLKAYKNWYYSLNMVFKTQLFNNYESDSDVRTASFLSPGDLNVGLGMSYNHKNKRQTFSYTLTISPLSYNLKTCITDRIDHSLYNIAQDRRTKNEIGSNAEINLEWKVTPNIKYNTRMFLFTDYNYFLGDWQNTFSFEINKFLSTQLFLHLRYDTSSDSGTGWKSFMLREILSFGLSYTFSTKP